METRVAVISMIITKEESVEAMNALMHQYAAFVVGRMGIPYRQKGVNIISIVIDAPMDQINALTGSLGRLDGVGVDWVFSCGAFGRRSLARGSFAGSSLTGCSFARRASFSGGRVFEGRYANLGQRNRLEFGLIGDSAFQLGDDLLMNTLER